MQENNEKNKEQFCKTRDLIRSVTKNPDGYDGKYLKICESKFDLDDDLLL